jgi:hypothetical protein
MFGIPVKKSRERLDKRLLIDVPRYDLIFQKLQIHPPIIIDKEHILAVVAALRDMMGESNCYCSG